MESRHVEGTLSGASVDSIASDFNRAKRRIPKLAVRNKPDNDAVEPPPTPSPPRSDDGSDDPTSSSLYPASHRMVRPGLATYHSNDSRNSSVRVHSRDGIVEQPAKRAAATNKKRGSGMLRFLTMKEPSTSAWEEFAEAQKKIAAERGGRAIGMPGVSSRQLPAHVPKTNSKWNGLPETAERKSLDLKNKRQFQTSSSAGRSSAAAGHLGSSDAQLSIYGRFHALNSKPLLRHDSRSTHMSRKDSESSALFGSSSQAGALTKIGSLRTFRDDAVAPWDEPPLPEEGRNTAVVPWEGPPLQQGKRNTAIAPGDKPLAASRDSARTATRAAVSFSKGHKIALDSSLSATTLPYHIDTSGFDSCEGDLAETPRLEEDEIPSTVSTSPYELSETPTSDRQHTSQVSQFMEADHQDVRVELGPAQSSIRIQRKSWNMALRSSQNFSRPLANPAALPVINPPQVEPTLNDSAFMDDRSVLGATLRNSTGFTSPFIFEEQDFHKRTRSQQPPSSPVPESSSTAATTTSIDSATHIPALSRMPSQSASIASSGVSSQRTRTPKERLGLGSQVTRRDKADVLPWEAEEPDRDVTFAGELENASSGSGGRSRLRRLSIRIGRR